MSMPIVESQASYDIAHLVARICHKLSPRDHLLVGDEPWTGCRGATGTPKTKLCSCILASM
jgi:hypothetical protein